METPAPEVVAESTTPVSAEEKERLAKIEQYEKSLPRKKTIGKKTYVHPPKGSEYHQMITSVIDKFAFNVGDATIEVVKVYPNISPKVVARIVKSNNELKFFTGFDYLIELSGETWDAISDDIRRIVIRHELRHVLVEEDADCAFQYNLQDHEVRDFADIIKDHGIDWYNELRQKVIQLYAFDAKIKPKDDAETQREKNAKLKAKQDKLMKSITL